MHPDPRNQGDMRTSAESSCPRAGCAALLLVICACACAWPADGIDAAAVFDSLMEMALPPPPAPPPPPPGLVQSQGYIGGGEGRPASATAAAAAAAASRAGALKQQRHDRAAVEAIRHGVPAVQVCISHQSDELCGSFDAALAGGPPGLAAAMVSLRRCATARRHSSLFSINPACMVI